MRYVECGKCQKGWNGDRSCRLCGITKGIDNVGCARGSQRADCPESPSYGVGHVDVLRIGCSSGR